MSHRRSDKDIKRMMHGKVLDDMKQQPCWGTFHRIEQVGSVKQSACGTCEVKVECQVEKLHRLRTTAPAQEITAPIGDDNSQ